MLLMIQIYAHPWCEKKLMSEATAEITENVANLQLDSQTGEMVSKS